jgi:predicted lipoprotein with Yx(FWY)xxD motif
MRTRMALLGAALLTVTLAACGGGSETDATGSTGSAAGAERHAGTQQHGSTTVKITQSDLGPILTDQAGRTLYAFTRDKGGTSNCAEGCIATWPALTSAAPVSAGAGTAKNLLGAAERAEGTSQAVYGDWPLYYYAGDTEAGDINGQGVDGVWFVLSAGGKLVRTAN